MKKKRIVSFLILLFLSSAALLRAQEGSSGKPISFGIKAGGVFSGFTNHQEVFTSMRGGLAAGAFFEYKPLSLLGIAVEANYIQEGAFHANPFLIYPASTVNYTEDIYKTTSDIRLHTFQVPVLLNIRAPKISGNAVPKLILGYSFDFISQAITKDMYMINGTSTSIPMESRGKEDVTSSFGSFNMGPVAGFGIDFTGENLTYMFEARYKVGLKDISNLGSLNSINNQYDFSVNTFTVTVGIGF